MPEATITCPACGDTPAAPHGDTQFLRKHVTRCDVCEARIAYGTLVSRVVVEPSSFDGGQPAMLIRIQHPITRADVHTVKLDPEAAFLVAQSIISMVRP